MYYIESGGSRLRAPLGWRRRIIHYCSIRIFAFVIISSCLLLLLLSLVVVVCLLLVISIITPIAICYHYIVVFILLVLSLVLLFWLLSLLSILLLLLLLSLLDALAWSDAESQTPRSAFFGWRHLSNATCLTRPHVFYACFVVSRITAFRYMIRHVWRTPASDKKVVLD